MIRIVHLDRPLAEVTVIEGKLHVLANNESAIWWILESMRYDANGKKLSDQEVYDALPYRMQGLLWAGWVD